MSSRICDARALAAMRWSCGGRRQREDIFHKVLYIIQDLCRGGGGGGEAWNSCLFH